MTVLVSKIRDRGLRKKFSKLRNGGLTYNEIKKLIRSTYDFRKVTDTEVDDLQYILDNAKLDSASKQLLKAFIDNPQRKPVKAIKNLASAKQAVIYVDLRMTIGASNKWASTDEAQQCVRRIRRSAYLSLQDMARKAEAAGCGNCGEQAAIAFMYLRRKGIRPLDYMSLKRPGDHAFVVIGRKKKSQATNPKSWGGLAAVCDPWMRKQYYGSQYNVRMYDTRHLPVSRFRID